MKLHLWRVSGATLLIGVFVLMLITNTRQLTTTYNLIDPSPDYAFAVALMIMGSMVLALMYPHHHATRWGFLALAFASILSAGINLAPRLGMIQADPAAWNWMVLTVHTLPFGVVSWMVWSLVVTYVSTPMSALLPAPPTTKTKSESDQNRNRNPKLLGESDRKSATMPRITISRLKAKSKPKPTPSEAETESESDTETKTNTGLDPYYVLEILRREGKVSHAAARLKISPTMVNNHIAGIFEVEPERVKEAVPNWVLRRTKGG